MGDILKWIPKKWMGSHGLDCSGSGLGQVAVPCECGNEPLGCVKCGEFCDSSWGPVSFSQRTVLHGVRCRRIPSCYKGYIKTTKGLQCGLWVTCGGVIREFELEWSEVVWRHIRERKWPVSFTPLPSCLQGKERRSPWHPWRGHGGSCL